MYSPYLSSEEFDMLEGLTSEEFDSLVSEDSYFSFILKYLFN